jgi:hypothetical protein
MYESTVAQNLTRLDVSACIAACALAFQTSHANLILIVADNNLIYPLVYGYCAMYPVEMGNGCSPNPHGRICGNQDVIPLPPSCQPALNVSSRDRASRRPFGPKIKYCLSEEVKQACSVQFIPQLAGVVIAPTLQRLQSSYIRFSLGNIIFGLIYTV